MNHEPLRILVTAIGGDLGQAIVKALRVWEQPLHIVGADIQEQTSGEAFVEATTTLPAAADDAYLDSLGRVVENQAIQVVIPASDAEIGVISALPAFPSIAGQATAICQPGKTYVRLADKLSCMRALEGVVPLAGFADGEDARAVDRLVKAAGFPLVVKPRRNSGSKGIQVVDSTEALDQALTEVQAPLVQAYIGEEDTEHTSAVYRGPHGTRSLTFKRRLGPVGCSWYAETVNAPDVSTYVETVAEGLNLQGSVNVQTRVTPEGPRLLEVNPRFSSLVAARALCGFQDVIWAIQDASGMDTATRPTEFREIRFQRFLHEIVDMGDGYHAIPSWQPRERVGDEDGEGR